MLQRALTLANSYCYGCLQCDLIEDYRPPSWPKDFAVRLGRLEDQFGGLREKCSGERRACPKIERGLGVAADTPTTDEARAMMLWAGSVSGGIATLLAGCSNTWPTSRNN